MAEWFQNFLFTQLSTTCFKHLLLKQMPHCIWKPNIKMFPEIFSNSMPDMHFIEGQKNLNKYTSGSKADNFAGC